MDAGGRAFRGLKCIGGVPERAGKLPTVLGKESGLSGSRGDLGRCTKSGRASVSFQLRCNFLDHLDG